MIYIFTANKDGHKAGETIDIQPSDWHEWYWLKKQVIRPFHRETEAQDGKPKKKKRK